VRAPWGSPRICLGMRDVRPVSVLGAGRTIAQRFETSESAVLEPRLGLFQTKVLRRFPCAFRSSLRDGHFQPFADWQYNGAMPDVANALQIRPATEADIPLVFGFIRKLAEYGDLADEVSATADDVRAALFGPKPVAECVIAYWGSEPAGFALYSYTFASFLGTTGIFIENLYVEPNVRNKGIGRALLVYLARLGRKQGCGRLEWAVLNWNERAMEFYQDLGAVPMDEWTTFRFAGDALERLASEGES
jgi:GNAT superfamily N-acetyltransferase